MTDITVIKLDYRGEEVWRWHGQALVEAADHVTIEAFFNLPDTHHHGLQFCHGDRMIETYFTDRWYNIFEVQAGKDGALRGWYCNIAHPATRMGDTIQFKDLALDLIVFPDGRQLVLDEDDFAALPLEERLRARAKAALAELQALFRQRLASSGDARLQQ
ncbi:MAG: DUF402 domain-containing protein [Chloroflexi bacterium]|nr:DUF402 domain-containing protein [Chloroflexota bacterium]